MGRYRQFIDDLLAVSASRLRAADIITAETTAFVVRLGDVEQVVAVTLRKFPNGGSWSLFFCPTCGRRAQVLRALNGILVCWRCCFRYGVRYRCEGAERRKDSERSAASHGFAQCLRPLCLCVNPFVGQDGASQLG